MKKPLSHITVLDLSRVMAGPWATQLLADLGAQVIKVEKPGAGDDTRHWGPPFLKSKDGDDTQESAYYLSANRGKRSVAIDMATEEGQQLIRRLAGKSDVLIENFKAGGLQKYGLDAASLRRENEQLIYCSITGFGQDGPAKDEAGYDYMIQARGGLMSVTGNPDEPMRVGVPIADIMTGMYAANAIQAALIDRERTGKGTTIDLALLDVQVAMLANQAMNYLVSGEVPQRIGNRHPTIVPYQVFHASDGPFVLAVGNDRQFQDFCRVAGCRELVADERFATNGARVRHRDALVPLLEAVLGSRKAEEWIAALKAANVPCGPIQDLAEVFDDPQMQHRQLKREFAHAQGGIAPGAAPPLRYDGETACADLAPPTLGQHTDEVLQEQLQLTAEELAALRENGVIE